MDLLADLDRMPKRDQGTRIRDLAMMGLSLSKGGTVAAVAVAAPTLAPSIPPSIPPPEEDARALRQKKLPTGMRNLGGFDGRG